MRECFYIGAARIEPSINTITIRDTSHKVEPKIMHVLLCLVEAKGEVVTKQQLFETVWAETIVVEMVLTRAISELRRILGDKPTKPSYIATISKSGYRLVAPIRVNKPSRVRSNLKRVVLPLIVIGLIVVTPRFLPVEEPPSVTSKSVTTSKGWEYHPAFSPNGEWVAYIGQPANDFSDLFLQSVNSDSSLKLTSSNGYYLKPTWSPDGRSLAAFGNRAGGSGLFIFSADSRQVTDSIEINTRYVGLSWSPDGSQLSYVAFDSLSSRHSVYVYSFETETSKLQVPTMQDSWGDSDPKYSPDGKSLAFVRTITEGNQDIYRLDLSTSSIHRLTKINRNILGFDWQDDQTLLVSSNLEGPDNLWRMKVDEEPSTPEKIIKVAYGESIQNPTVHGGLLIGERWIQDVDLKIYSLNQETPEDSLALASSKWELHPDISPDGDAIAFSSNRSGSYEIWMYVRSTSELTQLTFFGNGFSGKPKWSPNGDLIVFESNASGYNQIYVVDRKGENQRQVTDDQGDYINPTWSTDGSFIYCSSNVGGDWNIWMKALHNGKMRKVTSEGGYYLQEARQFGREYVTKLHQDGIWELRMDGSEEKVIDQLTASDWANWRIAEQGIYYFDRKAKAISFYHFETKETSVFLPTKQSIPANEPAFTISQASGLLLYGQLNSYSGDLIAIQNY